MKSSNNNTELVYSTEQGGMLSKKGKSKGARKKQQPAPKRDGVVRISRETKGRKGKGVTIITGLPHTMDDLRDLAKQLKQKCGSGGTVKDGVIEIQGDHRDMLVDELTKQGHTVKRSGG
ncbi:MAG: translation initiation factor Sui1 [Planctomycetes bacterium]|nr:translation initiation factor Sui1 [Planctomycetota bacterium]